MLYNKLVQRLPILLALVVIWGTHVRTMYRNSGNKRAWLNLVSLIDQLYMSEHAIGLGTPGDTEDLPVGMSNLEAKSILPSVIIAQVSALASKHSEETEKNLHHVGTLLGHIIWRIDELVDLLIDYDRGSANSLLSLLAERLVTQSRTWASDGDIYDVVNKATIDLVGLLKAETFQSTYSDAFEMGEHARFSCASTQQDQSDKGLTAILEFACFVVADWSGWQEKISQKISSFPFQVPTQSHRSVPASRALEMLLKQQRDGYREAIHSMRMPRLSPQGVFFEICPALLGRANGMQAPTMAHIAQFLCSAPSLRTALL